MYYQCKRCFYNTSKKIDMKRHLDRVIKCHRIIESYKYKDDELDKLSLSPISKNEIKIIQYIDLQNEVEDKKFENFDEYISYIDENNSNNCIYCNKIFFRKYELKRHLKNCKMIKDKTKQNVFINNNINNNVNNINNVNNYQQINNISINLYNEIEDKKVIVPFDEEWDISNIDIQKKILLFLSDNKYSKTIEEILKNEKNLNILFDKNSDYGLIYKNDVDKFTNMKSDEIIISVIYKLYNHLNKFYDEIKVNNFITSDLNLHKNTIEQKYNDFNNDKNSNVKNYVKNILIDIFEKYEDKIIENFLEFDKYISPNDKIGY